MEEYTYRDVILRALKEDIGTGDITTDICISEESEAEALFVAKTNGIICGLELVKTTYEVIDQDVNVEFNYKDGDMLSKGDIIGMVWGRTRSILKGERVALNFLQHLSGIATTTGYFVETVKGTKTRIVDTRKTTPGLRMIEKYAVRVGGGYNHRFGLYDGIMIKDNHIKGAGGISAACSLARKNMPHTLKMEVETSTLEEVQEALLCGADIIMLDNMSYDMMEQAVKLIDGKALVEASGNMADKDVKRIAESGVDLISVGAITNSIKNMDISLKFK